MARVVLILGAGPKLGDTIASAFADSGYKVALAARSLNTNSGKDRFFHVRADLSNPQAVAGVFDEVIHEIGPPNIVIYNGEPKQDLMR